MPPKHLLRAIAGAAALASVLSLLACGPSQDHLANGEGPLPSLRATVRSSRYGKSFWQRERDQGTALWAKAVVQCRPREAAGYPNCQVVHALDALRIPPMPVPNSGPGIGNIPAPAKP